MLDFDLKNDPLTLLKAIEAIEGNVSDNSLKTIVNSLKNHLESNGSFGYTRNLFNEKRSLKMTDVQSRYYNYRKYSKSNRIISQNSTKTYSKRLLKKSQLLRQKRLAHEVSELVVVKKITAHKSSVYCIKSTLNGDYILTGSDDYLIKKFRAVDMRLLCSFRGHQNCLVDILTVKSSAIDQEVVVSSSVDTDIRIWELHTTKCLVVLKWHSASCGPLACLKSILVTSADDGMACLWDLEALLKPSDTADINGSNRDEDLKLKRQLGAHVPLVLPHLNNNMKNTNVNAVARHPVYDFIATGADDGIGRIWSVSEIEHMQCRYTDNAYTLPNHGLSEKQYIDACNRLVCSLKAHTSSITNISWSNRGDKLLSASIKDGTVKVWYWFPANPVMTALQTIDLLLFSCPPRTITLRAANPNEDTLLNRSSTTLSSSKIVKYVSHLLDKMTSEGELFDLNSYLEAVNLSEEELVELKALLVKRIFAKEKSPTIDAATWTCDDSKIITMQSTPTKMKDTASALDSSAFSDQIMKVWCARTGNLLFKRRSHLRPSYCVIPHPFYPNLVATLGHDSQICFWNVNEGTLLKKIMVPSMFGLSPLLDGLFMKVNDFRLIVTDTFGRVIVLSSIYELVPANVLGEEVLLKCSKVYSLTFSEQFFKNEYAALEYDDLGFAVDAATRKSPHEVAQGPLCSSVFDVYSIQSNDNGRLDKLISHLDITLHQRETNSMHEMGDVLKNMEILVTLAERMDKRSNFRAVDIETLFKNIVSNNIRNMQEMNLTRPVPSTPTRPPGNTNPQSPEVELYDDDQSIRRSERQRERANQGRIATFRELAEGEARLIGESAPRSRRRAARLAGQRIRRYGDFMSNLNYSPSPRVGGSNESDDSEFSESDDSDSVEMVDDPEEIIRRNRRRRRAAFEDNTMIRRSSRRITSRNHISRGESGGESSPNNSEEEGDNTNLIEEATPTQEDIIERILAERGHLASLDKSWLQMESLNHAFGSYVPQLKDEVVFCGQAFEDFLDEYCPGQDYPNLGVPSIYPYILCRIESLDYQFPEDSGFDSIVVSMKLEIIGTPKDLDEHQHVDNFWDLTEERSFFRIFIGRVATFFVLRQAFEHSLKESWSRRDPVTCYYLNENNELTSDTGWVKAVDTYNESRWPSSVFKSLLIAWDSGGPDFRVSPWEIESIRNEVQEVVNGLVALDQNLIDGIVERFRNTIEEDFALPFLNAIDPDVVKDYNVFIPIPIHLNMIISRLENKFYRTVDMIKFDVKLICSNCTEYNQPTADISRFGRKLKNSLQKSIRDVIKDLQEESPSQTEASPPNPGIPANDNEMDPHQTEVSTRGRRRRKVDYSIDDSSESEAEEQTEISARGRIRRRVNYVAQNTFVAEEPVTRRSSRAKRPRVLFNNEEPAPPTNSRSHRRRTSNVRTLPFQDEAFLRRSTRTRVQPNYHVPDEFDAEIADSSPEEIESDDQSVEEDHLRRSSRSRGRRRVSYREYV